MKALNTSLKYFIVQKLTLSNKEVINFILTRRVLVNGLPGTLNQALLPEDEVMLDDQVIKEGRRNIYIAYHKPCGIESTTNTLIDNNLLTVTNLPQNVFPVGRLDKASEGLMLLTNDGRTSFNILHAEKQQEKEYNVTVDKPLTSQALESLASGIVIMGKRTRPAVVKQLDEQTFSIVLTQGLNRQIRRMCYKLGYQVVKLVRTRIITLELGELALGEWRLLDESEIKSLTQAVSKD